MITSHSHDFQESSRHKCVFLFAVVASLEQEETTFVFLPVFITGQLSQKNNKARFLVITVIYVDFRTVYRFFEIIS